MTDWKKLEDEVDIAIKKGCPINFDSKTIEEGKYQQKVAEDILSFIGVQINAIIFCAAFGVSISIAFIGLIDLAALTGYSLGIIILVISSLILLHIKNKYNRCRRIILNAEKRIISGDSIKPEPPQETTNTPPQVQENTQSKGQSIGQIEFIKARLDLNKMIMSALFGFMLVIAWTTIQNIHTWDRNIIAIAIIVNLSFGYIMDNYRKIYIKTMNELKDLP